MTQNSPKFSDKQVVTRSTPSFILPLSVSELNKVISGIKKAQEKTLSKCEALHSLQNK